MKKATIFIPILIIALSVIGCGGRSNPSSPDLGLQTENSGSAKTDSSVLWGIWDVSFNNATGNFDIIPLRTATFTANVNKIIEGKPGNLLIGDMDVTEFFSEGRLDCTVKLRHPFPGLDMYNGFDVWGVFMHNGSAALQYDDLIYSDGTGGNEAVLLNPDGYTRWFNNAEFDGTGIPLIEYWAGKLGNIPLPTATLNPYRIFADGLSAEDDYYDWITTPGNTDDRGIFRAGGVNERRYELKFPIIGGTPVADFQYAVVASWEPGDPALTGSPSVYDPYDFPTSANCEEPFFVNLSTIGSDLYFDSDAGEVGGTFRADVEVFDWQGGAVGGNGVPNEIEKIIFEGDFLSGGSYEIDQPALSLTAIPATENSSVFQIEIANCIPQASGETGFWIVVEAGGLNGGSYNQNFPTEFPEDAARTAIKPGTVEVGTESPVPEKTYHWEFDDINTFHGTLYSGYDFFDDIGPAIAEESDGEIGLSWNANDTYDLHSGSDSMWWLKRSVDNGATYGFDGWSDGAYNITRLDNVKVTSGGDGYSYCVSCFGPSNRWTYISRVDPGWPAQRGVFVSYPDRDIDIVVDGTGYVYAFDDQYATLGVKHSTAPYILDPWTWHQPPYVRFSIASPAYVSHVRSTDTDSSGLPWIAYYDSGETQIKLAHPTDSPPHESWNADTSVYSAGSGYSKVMNPSLFIDENDVFNICYTRYNSNSGKYQLVYVKDDSSFSSPDETVIYESTSEISEAEISIGTKFNSEIIVFMYEEMKSVWLITLVNGTPIGPAEEVDGSVDDIDPDVILDVDQCDLHSVYSTMIGTDYEVARRNGVLIEE